MKKIISFILFLSVAFSLKAQSSDFVCRIGFTFEISKSSNWGKNLPVVTTVVPYSSAETAGLKPSDIITAINGVNVLDVDTEEIPQLLNREGKQDIILTVSNLQQPEREILVKKDCKKANSITEDQLATAFAMYSIESTNERLFTCPFKYSTMENVNFMQFKTYAFTIPDENNQKLESVINDCIEKELSQKGMLQDDEDPDLLIQTFYFFDKNPNYKGMNKIQIQKDPVYRYNTLTGKMQEYPFLKISTAEAEAEYLLQLGIRLIDRRSSNRENIQIIWECEANELLSESFKLEEYARTFIPLMCMQYPYVKYKNNVQYKISYRTYNYTGISYDINKLNTIVNVDQNSPAYTAGIRNQDVIEKIENHKMDHTPEEFTQGYKSFITNTMQYRNPKTMFTNADGFKRCMYWDIFSFPKIADAIKKKEYLAAFSYLYFFAPYINPTGNNTCNFNIRRGDEKFNVNIRPAIRSEVTLQVN